MTPSSELRIIRDATPAAVRSIRHALDAFLRAHDVDAGFREDIETGVGEALLNAVEHAYDKRPRGCVQFYARLEQNGRLLVDVADEGRFKPRERPRRGRGFGLRIIRNVSQEVSVETNHGTTVRMIFQTRKEAAV